MTPAALLLLHLLTVAFLNSTRLSRVAVYSQNQFVQLAKMSYGGPYICPPPPLLHKLRQGASRDECRCTKLCSSGPISRAKKQQTDKENLLKHHGNFNKSLLGDTPSGSLPFFLQLIKKSHKKFGKKPISIEITDSHFTEVTFRSSSLLCAGTKMNSLHFCQTTNQQLSVS